MTIKFTKGIDYTSQKGDWFVWQDETFMRCDNEPEWKGSDADWLWDSQVLDLFNAGIIEITREVPDKPKSGNEWEEFEFDILHAVEGQHGTIRLKRKVQE